MKKSQSLRLFVLAVSILLQLSNGDVSFARKQKYRVFQTSDRRFLKSHNFSAEFRNNFRIQQQQQKCDLAAFRGRKRAQFFSPNRLVSTTTGSRKPVRDVASARSVSIEGTKNKKSLRGVQRYLFERFRFPTVSQETIQRLTSIFRICLVGYVGIELVLILREVFEEVFSDLEDINVERNAVPGSNKKVSSKKAFSKKSVERLISWLETPEEEYPAPPSNICPDWQISMARELHNCNLNPIFFRRILLQLTTAEAELLQKCLLPSCRKVEFSDIGGLFAAKQDITMELLSALERFKSSTNPLSEQKQRSSPYEEMIMNDYRHNNIALWGPPGAGKTLLIRAIAKHFPTLVISPILMQNYQQLETLFSLVSTLGPCFLVLDNLETLFPTIPGNGNHGVSMEVRTEFLQWWDTMVASQKPIFVVAATSHPWDIDTTAWGRFSNRIYVGLPNDQDRYHMLQVFTKDLPPIEDSVLKYFASATNGFMPLDIHEGLIRACINGPMSREDRTLTIEDINAVLSTNSLRTDVSAQYAERFIGYMTRLSTNQSQPQQTTPTSHSQDYFSPRVIKSFPIDNGYCFETALGNYYQLQIPVDSEVIDAIRIILSYSFELNSSEEWDTSDDDNDDGDFE